MTETGVDPEKDPQLAAAIVVNLSTDLSVKQHSILGSAFSSERKNYALKLHVVS
jgi:hypothetical protein